MRKKRNFVIPFILIVFYIIFRKVDFNITPEPENQKSDSSEEIVAMAAEEETSSFSQKQLTEIENLITTTVNTADGDVGISFVDLSTGEVISENGEVTFVAASTSKVALVMMLADKLADGEIKSAEEITYLEEDYEEGTGIIQNNIETSYSIEELMKDAIVYSDNIATNMLVRYLGGMEAVRLYYQENYDESITELEENYLTSNQAANLLTLLYEGSEENKYYAEIIQNMSETIFDIRLETTLTAEIVAHKIGSLDANVHDIGLFYAEKPYAVAIYTKNLTEGDTFISNFSNQLYKIITAAS